MNRRGFLGLISAAVAAYTLDPELALWVPGKKSIFLPPITRLHPFSAGDWVCWDGHAGWRLLTAASTGRIGVFNGKEVITHGPVTANVEGFSPRSFILSETVVPIVQHGSIEGVLA